MHAHKLCDVLAAGDRLVKSHDRTVHLVQQPPLHIITHQALDPNIRCYAHATRDRLHTMLAGGWVDRHVARHIFDFGKLQPVIDALVTHFQAERLKGESGTVM